MTALQSPRRRPAPSGARWLSGSAIVISAAIIAALVIVVALGGAVMVTAVSELLVER